MLSQLKNPKPVFSVVILFLFITSCEKGDDTNPNKLQDADGNSYSVVSIGEQVWMAENLKTTKFNDGTDILNVTNNQQWNKLSTPGFCWYDNDENNKSRIGALYNWYAVNTCKICPKGWHVPSDEEWTELEIYLENNGYNYDGLVDNDNDRKTNNKIGKALTSTTGWAFSENEGAIGNSDYPEYINITGFNLWPGGYRDANGAFQCLNTLANCWSSTEYNNGSALYRRFLNTSVKVLSDDHNKRDGFSIRCIKDIDPD